VKHSAIHRPEGDDLGLHCARQRHVRGADALQARGGAAPIGDDIAGRQAIGLGDETLGFAARHRHDHRGGQQPRRFGELDHRLAEHRRHVVARLQIEESRIDRFCGRIGELADHIGRNRRWQSQQTEALDAGRCAEAEPHRALHRHQQARACVGAGFSRAQRPGVARLLDGLGGDGNRRLAACGYGNGAAAPQFG
jgi:hypothetical protein